MKTSELIGKTIEDIKIEISNYDSNGELEVSNAIIKLESGEVFEIPNREDESIPLTKDRKLQSIFNHGGFLNKLFNKYSFDQNIVNRNNKNIKGKKIIGVYQFCKVNEEDVFNEFEEKMILEVESGFLISEIIMAPTGTGSAGIWIFTSKEDLMIKFGSKFKKIY